MSSKICLGLATTSKIRLQCSLALPVREAFMQFYIRTRANGGGIDDYSKYPDPSPGLYFSNQTWVDLQLKIYYENRTGEISISLECQIKAHDN